MLKQFLLKLLPVLILSCAQSAGMMDLIRCEFAPPKVMAQQPGDENEEIERLTQQLRLRSDTESNKAVIALGKMGASARFAVRQLFVIIFAGEPEHIRVNASTSIRQIVESSESEISQLLPLLKHLNPDVRANVAAAIGNIGKSNAYLIYQIDVYEKYKKESNPTVRANLATIVKQIENSGRIADSQLIPLLKDLNSLVRANAALAISNQERSARSNISQLIPLFQDSDATVRANAVASVRNMGKAAKSTIPQILPLLKDSDSTVRANAALTIGEIGGVTKSTISQILPLLKDSDSYVRLCAVLAVGDMKKHTKSIALQVLPLLQDSDSTVRYGAVIVIEKMEESAKSDIPGLEKLLQNVHSRDRIASSGLLSLELRKSTRSEIANLIPLLKDPDPRIRYVAADALGEIGN
ncbi:HEAT repeat domain-containing protein [Chamaesiphon minutus]|uniref:HEAT repeat-containing protein n=1 Tax=Chamaesiphon minutus (strain ATCC 27169 / PCC 6605) TaxID=1173020 RepID=K9UGV6_CHAP6|nr:HEAT repeat domain-containing protein [Chamaesiphon minutus]AFY94050.1 HEAT repeat-containing protein [Chamaesiphon minutus PCC 6605]